MKPLSSYATDVIIAILFSFTFISPAIDTHQDFLQCLYLNSHNSTSISKVIHTQTNTSYSSILHYLIHNLRFSTNTTPKPLIIVTPLEVSQIQATIFCSQRHGLQIRTFSGGHDFEGLSYVSDVPFVIISLINFREIEVNVENRTSWIGAGATLGEVFYKINEKSKTLGFPAGACPTVGVGGHFSGGGYGFLMRKHGLAADNIIDAYIIDVKGRVLNREAMGEDLFWAIRGGNGASFGVIISWKIKLVTVPETVTVFRVPRTLEQNATKLVHKWQLVANKIDENLTLFINLLRINSSQKGEKFTILASFEALFLGGVDEVIPLMQEKFPELGLVKEDCVEVGWIESVLYYAGFSISQPLEVLLERNKSAYLFYKAKSDYVTDPTSEIGLQGIWPMFYEDEAQLAMLFLFPYGGKMDEISDSEIPFPHRSGNLYIIQYWVSWKEDGDEVAQRHINWIRRLYSYMEPFVSKSPRGAYVNYRDLDLGVNNIDGYTSYEEARVWGVKYFNNNFKRLAQVKTDVDPLNFFRNEQSIPSLVVSRGRKWKLN